MIAQKPPLPVDEFVLAIEGRLGRSPLAVLLDIDGTLAPIAPTPEQAVVPVETRSMLRRLVGLPEVQVALVSGRSATDVLRMVPVEGAWIIGNHGLELRSPQGEIAADAEARRYQGVINKASGALRRLAQATTGALLEDKRWTLSLHYRLVDDRAVPQLIARVRDVAQELGLRATEGKRVIELRPPVDINKGTAAVLFAERVGALAGGSVLYAGDDQTDEDAFRELRRSSPDAVTVRIMDATAIQTGAATEAEYTLASPEDLGRVLQWLTTRGAA